ncbi:3-carboxy-cis,cis-muconate cycloisomerase [Neoaquamicrobium sediminum]|uniref:3-carboxy-cis,cis-muconate cycloisomerase n=1 Tax=Neoaquamicrobium sediminum TaxID=1849104 RepID=UPI004035175D
MTVSPFDHPFLSGLLGDEEVGSCFFVEADIAAMLAFETALAEAEAEEGLIDSGAAAVIAAALDTFEPDMDGLRAGVARDGVAVPELVRQLRAAVGEPHASRVHFGATSQDVIDTSLAIRLKDAIDIIDARLASVVDELMRLEARDGVVETMAHTRMQAAIPVPAARKIASWREPLERHRERLAAVRDDVCVLHFGGAAGTLEKLGDAAPAVTRRLAEKLGLRALPRARHSERDGIVEFASWLSLMTGSLGKMGQDVALMAQSEVGEVKLSLGGGSSAMPHKVNPVDAETLVALARFNATLVAGMHHAMVHENERSGAAWTLEWLTLPQMVVATASALRKAEALAMSIAFREGSSRG